MYGLAEVALYEPKRTITSAPHGMVLQCSMGVMPCTEEVCYGTNEVGTF
jgi:hypothetical protein